MDLHNKYNIFGFLQSFCKKFIGIRIRTKFGYKRTLGRQDVQLVDVAGS